MATTTSTSSTSVPQAPPVTALGKPESYALPSSWPTDPSQADLSYVQHVMDAHAVVDGFANKEIVNNETVTDQAKALIAEYSYNQEMVDIEIANAEAALDEDRARMVPGQGGFLVKKVVSISPQCFVAEVVWFRDGLWKHSPPVNTWRWMAIPPDSRSFEINPSPWRVAGYGKLDSPESKCSLEID